MSWRMSLPLGLRPVFGLWMLFSGALIIWGYWQWQTTAYSRQSCFWAQAQRRVTWRGTLHAGQIENLEILRAGRWVRVAEKTFPPRGLSLALPDPWPIVVQAQSPLSCQTSLRNPSPSGPFGAFTLNSIQVRLGKTTTWKMTPAPWSLRWAAEKRARAVLKEFPALEALCVATWFADEERFHPGFLDWNRAAGLGHVIAVSGQHVAILSFGFQLCFQMMAWVFCILKGRALAGRALWIIVECAPLFAGILLFVLCPKEGAVWRAVVAALLGFVFRRCHWSTSPARLFFGGLFLAVLLWPESGGDWGFLLSAAGAFLLFAGRGSLKNYFLMSIAMPIGILPMQLHFFSRVDLWTCAHNIAFAWLWGLIWIPLGFVSLPFALMPFGKQLLLRANALFLGFEEGVVRCGNSNYALLRPVFWEAIFWMLLWAAAVGWIFENTQRFAPGLRVKTRRTMR